MITQHDFRILWERAQQGAQPWRDYFPSIVALAAGLAILGAGAILTLPEAANVAGRTAWDESLCDKQAWPYMDRRCTGRAERAHGMRQVRVVSDRGTSVTMVTPMPIIDAKPKPLPPPRAVAHAGKPMGPPAVPAAAPVAESNKVAASPAATDAMAKEMPPKAAEKREARRQKAIEQNDGGVPADVVAAVKALPGGEAKPAVPPEVVAAVEEAASKDKDGQRAIVVDRDRGGQVVTIGSPTTKGQRIYLVPRERGD